MVSFADRLRRRLREWRHRRLAAAVVHTPPIRPAEGDGVLIFSMIGTRVLMPYLVAVKSLHAQLRRGRIAILDDGTLTDGDRAVLARHLGNPRIVSIRDVDLHGCPPRSCWERLLTLLDMRRDAYVIQLDSDTVTLGPVPEVEAAIADGRDFTLRGEEGATWLSIADFAASRPPVDPLDPAIHVQEAIEASLGRIDAGLPRPGHYVRGCAGFAGFAPGGLGRATAEAFSAEATALLGWDNWKRWGSEQVMSNVIVANEGEPVLLPYGRYRNYWDDGMPEDVRFVHFIGTCRYHGTAYRDATRKALQLIRAAG